MAKPPGNVQLFDIIQAWRERTGPDAHEEGRLLIDQQMVRLHDIMSDTLTEAAAYLDQMHADESPPPPIELNPRGSTTK